MGQHEIDAILQGLVQLNTRMVTTLERLEVSMARLEVSIARLEGTNARLELTMQAIRDILGRGNGR